MGRDLRHGLRSLLRRPGFTLLAAGTLALGLSTSAAVFTYVSAYVRPFPGAQVRDLYQVWFATRDQPWGSISVPDFEEVASIDPSVLTVSAVGQGSFAASVRHEQLTDIEFGQAVGEGFFSMTGIELTRGRGFTADEHLPGAVPKTIISHAYWVRQYQSDPDIIGRTILLNNEAYSIVGVASPEFVGAVASYRPQFWLPFEQFLRVYRARSDTRVNREAGALIPIVRLADGVTEAQASAALDRLTQGLDSEAPLENRERRFVLERATWISPEVRSDEASTTRIMMAAAAFLLLLACANVANLVLSAGAQRLREMAVRSAIGASRWRLIRQLLTENLLLSGLAGAAALLLAGPIASRLSSYFARPSVWGSNVPRELVVDPWVMLFALGAAVATGVMTGIVPALRASRDGPAAALRSGGRTSTRRRGRLRLLGTRDVLVSAQIALSVVLLFVAGLVLRTLENARDVDAGFETDQTLASYVSTSSMGLAIEERHRFFEDLMRRFEALPWVETATVAEYAPLSSHPSHELVGDDGDRVSATIARVWSGYFEALEMPILRGRGFEAADTTGTPGVVVVNESMAARLAPDGNVLGRTITYPARGEEPSRSVEVVGVVRDAKQVTLLDEAGPVAFFALQQEYSRPGNALLVRARNDPRIAVDAMRRELRDLDTRLAIVNILPYREVVRGSLYTQRMNAELFTVIALLGLVLASAGVFAVVALAVAAQRREIGIRMAIGADRRAVAKAVLGPVGGAVLVGLGVGLLGAFVATRWVGSLLLGVEPADPASLVIAIGVLLVAVASAVLVPLQRAMRVDPVGSLRAD